MTYLTHKLAIASALSVIALAGAPMVASAHEDNARAGLHLGILMHQDSAHNGAKEKKDKDIVDLRSHVRVGIVTAVNGGTFTIESFGAHPKTVVTTDASTVIKAKQDATTSSAITVGSHVFVVGTTSTASSTNETFTASLVKMLGKGLGHLKFWLWF